MEKMKKFLILGLMILGLIAIFDLFHPGLPVTHDGQDHVARIANFYQNLAQGNIIPRWAANLNWGYGHPILEFLYPLPSYIVSLFHFSGFSLIDSTKIVFGLGIIFSGLFMFLWLGEFLIAEAAFVGAALYMFAPYRFVDLYVRGDIGENLAFVFMPLTLYFILKLSKKLNFWHFAGTSISLALLILSHNAISLMFMPFIIFYGFLLGFNKKEKKEYLVNFFVAFILGFGLSAFFWIPGLFEAKYTLRNIVTKGGYFKSFVDFKSLLYGSWSYGGTGQFTVQFGILQWLFLLISPFVTWFLWTKKNKNWIILVSLIIYGFIAIFIMLPQSNFIWGKFIILQNFQFPWRFLAIIVFSTSVIGALVFNNAQIKIQKIAIVVFVIVILFLSKDYWHAKDYLREPETFFTGIYNSTTDTGESSPIWSVRFMEKRARANMEVLDGNAKIKQLKREVVFHKYKVDVARRTLFEENTLYFPGWEIKANGTPVNIEFQDQQHRGVMLFFLDKGNYTVEVSYKETKLRLVADIISIASLFILLFYNIGKVKLWR